MNFASLRRFRDALRRGQSVYGLWITMESPAITEIAVSQGLDWIVVDAEHGHLDWGDIVAHLRASARSRTVALVRVAENSEALIKRALDLGADGVVIPRVETAQQLRAAMRFASYPPAGTRGIGTERATRWGDGVADYVQAANEHLLVVPILESVRARTELDEMLDVCGPELFYLGPADYSASAGFAGQWQGPGVAEAMAQMLAKVRARGKSAGIVATSAEDLAERARQGFRVLGIGFDTGLVLRGLRQMLSPLEPAGETSNECRPALARPPAALRPDRMEAMATADDAPELEIAPGVTFRCLVGSHNQARGLTTGIVRIEPGADVPYHEHPCSESMTLLSGAAEVEVEGRAYRLAPLDNVTVLAHRAHRVRPLGAKATVLHVAMAMENPTRTLVADAFSRRAMPEASRGWLGSESIVRTRRAAPYEAGSGTRFVDFCNQNLMPGIEMSGGYGEFEPGGRLPAHCHDFDESISIVSGTATCVVEGRRYELTDATALQPRGRIHYFQNESSATMAMIWFYAGPSPVRIAVDEACATHEGNPWKLQEVQR